jgi:hypothetical protein
MYYQNITRVPWFESMIDYQYSANRIRQHLVTAGIAVTGAGAVLLMLLYPIIPPELPPPPRLPEAFTAPGLFFYTFNNDGTLYETSKEEWSSSPYWWLTSGGKLVIEEFVGKTNHGDLPITDPWRVLYAASNPLDTDNGRHPQNIFRLATKRTGTDVRVETLFKIERDNFSDSSNRNATNGLLLMSRYVDYNNLYYAGVRVDGAAVIKKKYNGRYYTLAYEKIFPGTYRRETM